MGEDLETHKYIKHTPMELQKFYYCKECNFKPKLEHNVNLHKNRKHVKSMFFFIHKDGIA